ncbi:NADH-dependent flavin oxidoreductase [Paenibacillus glycinis]|uniref:NADH-dependent flavin oxidoreductase n=1 Tax=Paenibacillus glycinis TaxID=2697035 RepID=A0ABW9Y133_9BACL|nr:NADH-dependent flavin oxidoreductase [Paenibacillus glycinis]NBD28169.1 NADH-dependent flavin oxidoreductase [Paenibacillus glycinis]
MNPNHKPIFEPFTLPSGVRLKNRVFMAPMTNSSSHPDGSASEQEIAYYRARAGGVGAVVTGSSHVLPDGKAFVNELGADHDALIPGLRRLSAAIRQQGAKAILQLFHAGRMAPPALIEGKQPISASGVAAERPDSAVPREMTEDEIEATIQAFGDATRRAIEAGFDGVEIHGANTFLIQQFFSPHSNRRADRWGGSLEARMAFPLAVVERVKQTVAGHAHAPFIVGYRVSPEEREEPGIAMADTLRLVEALADRGLDYVHVSVRGFWEGSMRDEADTRSRVLLIQEQAGHRVPVIGVGGFSSAEDVTEALDAGVAFISLAHAIIMEPNWVEKVQNGQAREIRTTLPRTAQRELVLPDPLWNMLLGVPGWFPVE